MYVGLEIVLIRVRSLSIEQGSRGESCEIKLAEGKMGTVDFDLLINRLAFAGILEDMGMTNFDLLFSEMEESAVVEKIYKLCLNKKVFCILDVFKNPKEKREYVDVLRGDPMDGIPVLEKAYYENIDDNINLKEKIIKKYKLHNKKLHEVKYKGHLYQFYLS